MTQDNLQIIALATEYRDWFKLANKQQEGVDDFYVLNDDAPDELKQLIDRVHGEESNDRWLYRFTFDAFATLTNIDEADADQDFEEWGYQLVQADICTYTKFIWLSENVEAVDQYVEEWGLPKREDFVLSRLVSVAQVIKKREVYFTVLSWLKTLVDECFVNQEESKE